MKELEILNKIEQSDVPDDMLKNILATVKERKENFSGIQSAAILCLTSVLLIFSSYQALNMRDNSGEESSDPYSNLSNSLYNE